MDLRTRTIRLCLLVLLASGTHVWGQRARETYNGREVASNEIVIRLKDPSSSGVVNLLADMLPADSVQILNQDLGLVLVHSPSRPVAALLDLFANRGDLFYAEPNFTVQALATPNDPYIGQLWGIQKIGGTLAWDITRGNKSTVVGIVDTGVNYNHPDLAANMWSAPTAFTVTVGGTKITCPAGSHGLNAITMTCDPADDHGHGTHVSGTIGAVGDNGIGVAGVNWTTSIMALRFMDASGSGAISNAIRAINFAIQVKLYYAKTATPVNVRVLSNSWGGSGFSQSLLDAINSAGANDILFVAAAGNSAANNDTIMTYPASYGAATEISVAATDGSDELAGFSNYGQSVHLGAPGVAIVSTYGGDYGTLSGTSMAAPHVAGAAALVLSGCPDLNTAKLKSLLLTSVDPAASLVGRTSSGGRLNVNKALQACNASKQSSVSSVTVDPTSLQSGQSGSITVGLTGPAGSGGMAVTLSSSSPASVSVPASITVPQGQSSAKISFIAGAVTAPTPFTVTASAYGVSKTASGAVNPALASVAVSAGSFQSGQSGSITVGLAGPAGPGGTVVALSSSSPATVNVPSSVTVPQGQSSVTISFKAGAVAVLTPFTITASAYGVSVAASGAVTPVVVWIPSSAPAGSSLGFISGFSTNFLRNDYTGLVGMQITVGADPLKVSSVGRMCAAGNSGSHTVKFVNVSDGTDVAGASAAVNLQGCTTNQFVYASLPSAVTLQAGASYFLVSQEQIGSDQWYDVTSVTSRAEASIRGAANRDTGAWGTSKSGNFAYGPIDFLYVSAPVPKTVRVSIRSSPANHSLVVDGVTYNSGQTLQWTPGSSHSVSAPTQSTGAGIQSVWFSWSDGGAQTHTVAPASDTELIANFKTQYFLSTTVTPADAGTITATPSSPTGYYDEGSTVQLSVAANTGSLFLNWTGDLLGSLLSQTVTMSSPRSVTAAFSAAPTLPGVPVTPIAPVIPSTSFVNGYALSGQSLRNDFSGWVGMKLTVGSPMNVTSLGRLCIAGNKGSHIVKFVNASTGADVPGGSIAVDMASCTAGQFQFASLPSSLTLLSGSSYYLVSQETQGGDRWYDVGQISTNDAVVTAGVYSSNGSGWNTIGGQNSSYEPPSFQYSLQAAAPGSALVTGFDSTSPLRGDFGGWVGMRLTVGTEPITVSSLARMCAPGNSRSHKVKLVRSSLGIDAADGSVTIDMSGCTAGQFKYADLGTPMVLQPKTSYYLVSQEVTGGDVWYDLGTVSISSGATVNSGVYSLLGLWLPNGGPSMSYGPLNLK